MEQVREVAVRVDPWASAPQGKREGVHTDKFARMSEGNTRTRHEYGLVYSIFTRANSSGLKATALLKLTYLEMFGHDMSWASFNVLEVMSSPTYAEKKIGYLAAIQSFRPDTEVLMLAENLLKKVGTPQRAVSGVNSH